MEKLVRGCRKEVFIQIQTFERPEKERMRINGHRQITNAVSK